MVVLILTETEKVTATVRIMMKVKVTVTVTMRVNASPSDRTYTDILPILIYWSIASYSVAATSLSRPGPGEWSRRRGISFQR